MDDPSNSPEAAAPLPPEGVAEPQDVAEPQGVAPAQGIDGRRSKRRAFPFRQRVAFGVWEGTPPDEAFVEVTFHDVSASGCSFMAEARPTEERLLVQLGTENHIHFVQAEVVHCTPKSNEGVETYLVGCRFLRRVE